MKRLKRKLITAAAAAALLSLSLTGCGKYTSHYNAVGFVHSNLSGSAYMDFYSFDGTMVFTLDNEKGTEGRLKYSASLETGSAEVWFDRNGSKEKLFSLSAGDEVSSTAELSENETVYVIVETNGECMNGDLEFETE